MTRSLNFLGLGLIVLLPACATIVDGTKDTVTATTTPPGAACAFDRKGERIGAIPMTPGSVTISKSVHPMQVTCDREGYQTAMTTVEPEFTGWTLGNILLGGVVGIAVDMASGANGKYPNEVRVALTEKDRPMASAAPAALPVEQAADAASAKRIW